MKKVFLFIAVSSLLLSGCLTDVLEDGATGKTEIEPKITVRALNVDAATGSVVQSDVLGQVVFTGNDILWFNETTKELRFKDNMLYNPANNPVFLNTRAIGFYIGGEFLFSSMVYVDSSISQIFDSLVLYYNTVENKYFLLDGYPPNDSNDLLPNGNASFEIPPREKNRNTIAVEWNKFVNQLKAEEKYKN